MILGSFLYFYIVSDIFALFIHRLCFLHRYYKSFRDSKIFVVVHYAFDFLVALRKIPPRMNLRLCQMSQPYQTRPSNFFS